MWDGTAYNPYSAQNSGKFDNTTTSPVHTSRLNYDGIFYATKINGTGSSDIGVEGTSVSAIGVRGNSTDDAGVYGGSINSYGVQGYSPSSRGIYGLSSSGYAIYGITSSGTGIYSESTSGKAAYFSNSGTSSNSQPILYISRVGTGSVNLTGDAINIVDNPATSGTISGSILKATIATTVRVDMNPRVTDGASAVAYLLDTNSALSTAGSKLVSVRNNAVERLRITPSTTDIACGTSTTFSTVGGVLKDFFTTASSTGGENDLYSYSVPANVLAKNGDKLTFKAILQPNPSALSAIVKVYFAGTAITILSGTSLSSQSIFTTEITRVSSSVCRVGILGVYNGASQYVYSELTSKDWTTSNILKITGQSSGQIDALFGYIEYKPAGLN
jgi:hypothetical protein